MFRETLNQEEFDAAINLLIEENGWSAWMLETEIAGRGYMPAGVCFAWLRGRIVEIADLIWFKWTSDRNIWEAAVNFFDSMRKSVADEEKDITDPTRYFMVFEYARFEDKRFFEKISDKGVLRKVGHIHGLYPDKNSVMFQTRSPVR